jgi:hypothetical protein
MMLGTPALSLSLSLSRLLSLVLSLSLSFSLSLPFSLSSSLSLPLSLARSFFISFSFSSSLARSLLLLAPGTIGGGVREREERKQPLGILSVRTTSPYPFQLETAPANVTPRDHFQ